MNIYALIYSWSKTFGVDTSNIREELVALCVTAQHDAFLTAARQAMDRDKEMAFEISKLKSDVGDWAMTDPTFSIIVASAAGACGTRASDVLAGKRDRASALARQIVTVICHDLHRLSYPEIAERFGRSSHSPFLAGARRMREAMAKGGAL